MEKHDLVGAWNVLWDTHHKEEGKLRPYSPNHTFDENQSVKWNREQVEIHNEELVEKRKELQIKVKEDKKNLLLKTYEFYKNMYQNDDPDMSIEFFNKVWEIAYYRGHSNGYWCVFDEIDDILDSFYELNNLRG